MKTVGLDRLDVLAVGVSRVFRRETKAECQVCAALLQAADLPLEERLELPCMARLTFRKCNCKEEGP